MKFNEKLFELRKQKGWSQEELGFKLNVTRQTISKWEIGETSPKLEELQTLSKLFEISVDELIGNEAVKEQTYEIDNTKKKTKIKMILKWIIFIILAIYLGYSLHKYLIINEFLKRYNNSKEFYGFNYGIIEIITDNNEIISWKQYCNDKGVLKVYDTLGNTIKKEEHFYGEDKTECVKSICYEYDLMNKTYTKKEYDEYYSILTSDFESDSKLQNEINSNIIDSGFFRKVLVSLNPMYFMGIRDDQIGIAKGIFNVTNNFYRVTIDNGKTNNNYPNIMYFREHLDENNKAHKQTTMYQKITLEKSNEFFDTETEKCILIEE